MAERFQIIGKLGSGGSSNVYVAQSLSTTSLRVALKVMKHEWVHSPNAQERFRDEGRLLTSLRHPHIVAGYGITSLQSSPALVLECLDGFDLSDVILTRPDAPTHDPATSGTLPVGVTLDVLAAVADALHYLQVTVEGFHRDLKPSNIRLTHSGGVKVLDLGIANSNLPGREAQTSGVFLAGTRDYMPPEQHRSPASDVYSLGLTVLTLLTGPPPLRLEGPESHQRALEAFRRSSDVPPQLVDLLCEALAYDAAGRPTAEALRDRARHLRRQQDGPSLREWLEKHLRSADDTPAYDQADLCGLEFEFSGHPSFAVPALSFTMESATPKLHGRRLRPGPLAGAFVLGAIVGSFSVAEGPAPDLRAPLPALSDGVWLLPPQSIPTSEGARPDPPAARVEVRPPRVPSPAPEPAVAPGPQESEPSCDGVTVTMRWPVGQAPGKVLLEGEAGQDWPCVPARNLFASVTFAGLDEPIRYHWSLRRFAGQDVQVICDRSSCNDPIASPP